MPASFSDVGVVVTGGAGLIGSFLVDELVQCGARVRVVDDFSKGRESHIAHHDGRVEVIRGDLENADFACNALAKADIVFHLASRAFGVGYSSTHHFNMLEHNERITNNVLGALYRSRPKHLLVVSSSCVYRDDGPSTIAEVPVFDGEPEDVNRGYGWAKRFLEQKAEIFSSETGVPISIVRPFNIYGERYQWLGDKSQAIPMLVKKVMDGSDPVFVWGSGTQRRSYIHAVDCARMMLAVVRAQHRGPVNLGTPQTITMLGLVGLICQLAGLRPQVEIDMTKPEGRFVKSADMSRFYQIAPAFALKVPLKCGLQRMLSWYKSTFGAPVGR